MRMPYKMALLCCRLREKGPLRQERHEIRARCPAHQDRNPSLYIGLDEGLRGLVFCRAGCSAEAVMRAVDLSLADLYCEDDRWVEVDANFEIVGEDVDPDQGAFTAMEICNHAGDA